MRGNARIRGWCVALVVFAAVIVRGLPPPAGRDPRVAPEPVDSAAQQAAADFIHSHFNSDCGPDTFGKCGQRYWQYAGFAWSLSGEPLTVARHTAKGEPE